MISCSAWQLYVIIDRTAVGVRGMASVAAGAIRGGADVIQLRDKGASVRELMREAHALLPITRRAGIPLMINDRADVVLAVGADGVHLGQDALPIQVARQLLGPDRFIGCSTHSLEQALAAEREGADYLGCGPVFPTPTKPNYASVGTHLIAEVTARVHIPVVCIGGIEAGNVTDVLQAGGRCVAVVRAVCGAQDPQAAAMLLKRAIVQFTRSTKTATL